MADIPSYKVILLGDVSVGKSCLVNRYMTNEFQQLKATIVPKSNSDKLVQTEAGESFFLSIWDTAGSEKYRSFSRQYYRNASTVIIVFSLEENSSLENVGMWIELLREENQTCNIIVVGTKCDLVGDDRISEAEVELNKKYGELIDTSFSCSALTGFGVDNIFNYIIANVKPNILTSNQLSFKDKADDKCKC